MKKIVALLLVISLMACMLAACGQKTEAPAESGNKVKVGIVIDGGDAGRGWSDHNFYMHTSTLWKIYQFLEAVGLRKKGDTTAGRIPWEKVAKGLTCRVEIHPRDWDGKEYNEVDKWFPADSAAGEGESEELDDSDF